MDRSATCTPDNSALNTSRDFEMICESRGAMTPVTAAGGGLYLTEAPSPLGQLDPHRLRDMVVDQQNASLQPHDSPYKKIYWTPSPVAVGMSPSPSNMRSTPANSSSPVTPTMQPPRLFQGSSAPHSIHDPMISPNGMRNPMLQQQIGMCMSAGRSPMGSPSGMHPLPSPYVSRPSSNAPASPYMQPPQTPVRYQTGMQSPASAGMPPSSPCAIYSQRMQNMGPSPQQFDCQQSIQPQWPVQMQQQSPYITETIYMSQAQMMSPSGPAQRVMVQRVPYPGCPPGMSMQSPSAQPPPSPVVYPQGAIVANAQPHLPVQQQQQQQQRALYIQPTTSQSSPGAMVGSSQQYPPPAYFHVKSGQTMYSTQPPIYRQQQSQSVSVRAYLGSNQGSPMSASPAYTMYSAPTSAAPPQQPSQQYSPVGRFPTPTASAAGISTCYQQSAHGMRSPHLLSPTQAGVAPTGAVAQGVPPAMVAPVGPNAANVPSNAPAAAPQHMRIVTQPTPFFGHDPGVASSIQSDMCLVGCFFVVIEHEKVLVDRLDVNEMSAVVRLHGGEIEFGVRAYNNVNSDRVTHVICESMRHQLIQQALKERKRCVTLQWLNDVLIKKHLEAPWRVFHLPTFWVENHRPAAGKIIAINGFSESERCGVRMMINAIGARFTPYLTKHNHLLVTKSCEGEKVERCRELGIPVVTYQWLVELYLGLKTAINENECAAYSPLPGMVSDINATPYSMEHYSEPCKQLLAAWKTPVVFTNEQWQRALDVRSTTENDESIFPNKYLRMSTPPPSDSEIESRRAQMGGAIGVVPVVCFSGFTPEEKDIFARKVRFLGGNVTDNVIASTHLVVLNLWRTAKLLEAIAVGKNVVGPNWVTDGYRYRRFPDTLDYFARDEENEKVFGYNLKYSVLKARRRRLFEDVTFYLTPSVEPSYAQLSSLICSAGGKVLNEKPHPHFVLQCIETDSPLLLISNDSDVHLLQYLTDAGMPVFNVEIILTGLLRQKVENSPLYRVTPIRPPQQSDVPPSSAPRSVQSNSKTYISCNL